MARKVKMCIPENRFFLDLNGFASGEVLALCIAAGSAYATATKSMSLNKWHQCAGVFVSATERHAYLDGGNKGSNSDSINPVNIDTVRIGADWNQTSDFDGDIDYIMIWNRALSAAEIQSLYIKPFQMFDENEIALSSIA